MVVAKMRTHTHTHTHPTTTHALAGQKRAANEYWKNKMAKQQKMWVEGEGWVTVKSEEKDKEEDAPPNPGAAARLFVKVLHVNRKCCSFVLWGIRGLHFYVMFRNTETWR